MTKDYLKSALVIICILLSLAGCSEIPEKPEYTKNLFSALENPYESPLINFTVLSAGSDIPCAIVIDYNITFNAEKKRGSSIYSFEGMSNGEHILNISCGKKEKIINFSVDYTKIKDCIGLQNMKYDYDADYELADDIDCKETLLWNQGKGFEPIGDCGKEDCFSGDENPFTGKFDGKGHVIKKLHIDRPDKNFVGIFGYIDKTEVKNVGVVDFDVKGKMFVGSLFGWIHHDMLIDNVFAEGNVSAESFSGILTGINDGNLTNSRVKGNIVASGDCIGGLAGYGDGLIINSTSSGTVIGADYVGGLTGVLHKGGRTASVYNSYSSADVKGENYVGGLVGRAEVNTTISNSSASGKVESKIKVGRLLGENQNATII